MLKTATVAVLRLEKQHIQDYLLLANGLMHRTPCDLVLEDEEVGFTDTSTLYIATASVQHSYSTCPLSNLSELSGARSLVLGPSTLDGVTANEEKGTLAFFRYHLNKYVV